MRKAAVLTAAFAVVAALVIGGVMLGRLRGHTRFVYLTGQTSGPAASGWEDVAWPAGPGLTVRGRLHRPASSDAPWLLFVPGNDPTPLATGQRVLDAVRGEADLGLAVFAYRGFDASGGAPSPEALPADTLALAQRLLRDQKVTGPRLHVVGFSMGTTIAARVAAGLAASQQSPQTLSLLASTPSLELVPAGLVAKFLPSDTYSMVGVEPQVKARVLVMHGENDTVLPPRLGAQVAAAFGPSAKWTVVNSRGHEDLLEAPEVIAALRAHVAEAPVKAPPLAPVAP